MSPRPPDSSIDRAGPQRPRHDALGVRSRGRGWSGRHLGAAIALVTGLTFSTVAWACPVCGQTAEQSRLAYLAMTLMMSFTPLLLIGGVIAWLIVRAKRADASSTALANGHSNVHSKET